MNGPKSRWFLLICAVALMIFVMGCATMPEQRVIKYEALPEGAKLTQQAETLPELERQLKPQISFGGQSQTSSVFVWYHEEKGNPVFILDCAYPLFAQGKKIWGMLDAHSDDGLDYEHPIRQFMQSKYAHREMRLSDSHSDGDKGFIALVSTGPYGDKIYEVVYNSLSGHRGQEDTIAFLVLVSQGQKMELLAKNFSVGGDRSGWVGINDDAHFKVDWLTGSRRPAFEITVIEETYYYPASDSELSDLTFFRNGKLTGKFPMKMAMEPISYIKGDGKMTLNEIAVTMSVYFSGWLSADWVTLEQKNLAAALWAKELAEFNPAMKPDKVIPIGDIVYVPDGDAFSRKVLNQINSHAQHDLKRAGQ